MRTSHFFEGPYEEHVYRFKGVNFKRKKQKDLSVGSVARAHSNFHQTLKTAGGCHKTKQNLAPS